MISRAAKTRDMGQTYSPIFDRLPRRGVWAYVGLGERED
jgi:hypothetical protein